MNIEKKISNSIKRRIHNLESQIGRKERKMERSTGIRKEEGDVSFRSNMPPTSEVRYWKGLVEKVNLLQGQFQIREK